ncbi:response regulator [uncultured Desulfosarcina sp.]|uniref:response regulator n=1 Tax=uncultured Desulfosarcina sp. TaxID=218289 RepID=UPI0029C78A72|nr:response regulator [uncultured Desulfosarcina sp.]
MTQLLFVTTDKTNLADLSAVIETRGGTIIWATSGGEALERIGKTAVDLVLADEILADMTGLELIKRLVTVNPMINCAAVSSLSKEAYHEASEGLGILMQLPPQPARADGERMMAHLNQIIGLSSPKKLKK